MASISGKLLLDGLLSEFKLVVIEKQGCPYCSRLRKILDNYKLKDGATHILNIAGRPDGDEIQKSLFELSQSRTVPQVFVAGQYVGGATDVEKLHKTGQLESLLKQNLII